uniref:Uncharacterized protein n=1 Tax=Timema cristinae TaxID=61476 RepID=A0A7R9DAK8_TIMCR|nr:unnamed protein product [Timema cristinae]
MTSALANYVTESFFSICGYLYPNHNFCFRVPPWSETYVPHNAYIVQLRLTTTRLAALLSHQPDSRYNRLTTTLLTTTRLATLLSHKPDSRYTRLTTTLLTTTRLAALLSHKPDSRYTRLTTTLLTTTRLAALLSHKPDSRYTRLTTTLLTTTRLAALLSHKPDSRYTRLTTTLLTTTRLAALLSHKPDSRYTRLTTTLLTTTRLAALLSHKPDSRYTRLTTTLLTTTRLAALLSHKPDSRYTRLTTTLLTTTRLAALLSHKPDSRYTRLTTTLLTTTRLAALLSHKPDSRYTRLTTTLLTTTRLAALLSHKPDSRLPFKHPIIIIIIIMLITQPPSMEQYGLEVLSSHRLEGYGTVPTSLGRFRNAFTVDMENELAEHCRQLDSRFYGLTRRQLMKLSFEFAEFKGVNEYFAPEEVNYRIEANETDNFAENAIEPAYSTVQSSTNIMERTEDILANSSNTVLSAEHIHYQENDSNSAPNQRSLQGIDSIHPLPKSQNEKKRHRAHQKSEVLSATPFKNCLLQKEKEKLEKEERKNQRNKRKMENAANKLDFSKPFTSKKASLPKSVKTNKETFCGGCGELFEEDWVQCGSCSE